MSDTVFEQARPLRGYSAPSFERERIVLHHRYATLAAAGHITRASVLRMTQTVPRFVYASDAPLSDGYVPLVVVFIRTRQGKVAIVFPKCNDESRMDDTVTDRSLTIHTLGEVTIADMVVVQGNVLRAMPMPLKPRDESLGDTEWEPCGFAGRSGAT